MKIVYMGTPEIAKVCLEKLYTEGFDIAAVYTKPDTPKNRGMKLIPSEVKAYAVSVGLPVVQPQLQTVAELDETERGTGGFGSTGR